MRATPIDSDQKRMRSDKRMLWGILLLMFVIFVVALTDFFLIRSRKKIVNEQIRIYADYQIADRLNKHLFFGTIWKTIVEQNNGEVVKFAKTTESLLKNYDTRGIESISVPQANHVVYAHSLDNAYPLRREIYTDPALNSYIIRSKYTGLQSVSSLLEIEGTNRYRMYVLTPIYIDGDFEKREFWGMSVMSMIVPDIFEGIGLEKISTEMDFKLSGAVAGSTEHQTFIASTTEAFHSPEVYYFNVPNGTWKIEGEWKGGWITSAEIIRQVIVVLFIAVVVFVLSYINFRRAQLTKISMMDELTGIHNRYALRVHFPEFVGTRKDIFVLFIDVDRFKEVNDTYGHEAGDIALQSVSAKLRDFFGEKHCYRYGGDEFLIIQKTDDGEKMKAKLNDFATSLDVQNTDGSVIPITLSAGCCVGKAENGDALRRLMKEADEKLYEAKHNGKNQIDM